MCNPLQLTYRLVSDARYRSVGAELSVKRQLSAIGTKTPVKQHTDPAGPGNTDERIDTKRAGTESARGPVPRAPRRSLHSTLQLWSDRLRRLAAGAASANVSGVRRSGPR
jgi:hypothetical protein